MQRQLALTAKHHGMEPFDSRSFNSPRDLVLEARFLPINIAENPIGSSRPGKKANYDP